MPYILENKETGEKEIYSTIKKIAEDTGINVRKIYYHISKRKEMSEGKFAIYKKKIVK